MFSSSVIPWTVAHPSPLAVDSSGKDTGEGCHFLLEGTFSKDAGGISVTGQQDALNFLYRISCL